MDAKYGIIWVCVWVGFFFWGGGGGGGVRVGVLIGCRDLIEFVFGRVSGRVEGLGQSPHLCHF